MCVVFMTKKITKLIAATSVGCPQLKLLAYTITTQKVNNATLQGLSLMKLCSCSELSMQTIKILLPRLSETTVLEYVKTEGDVVTVKWSSGKDIAVDMRFEEAWEAYPRKTNKKGARSAWMQLNPTRNEQKLIINSINEHIKYVWDSMQFVPHFSTFLNGERYKDEIDKSHLTPAHPTGVIV